MASRQQTRIQVYLETNRIGPLFEELMTKLITETPDQPIPFLINHLQSKLGNVGQLHRTLSGSAALWAESESENKGTRRDFRCYDKPWQMNAKKPKKSKSDLAVCNISPPSPESKSLPRSVEHPKWDWRTKPESQDFDELNHILQESKKLGKALESLSRSIAVTDELEQDTRAFNSSLLRPCVIGEWVGREDNDIDPLAAEMIQPPVPRNKNEQREEDEGSSSPAGSLKMEPKNKGLKQQQQQHKKLLAAMLSQDSFDSVHSTAASLTEEDIDNEDDAMELLEDLDDLRMEGVMPSGSKFSQGRSTYSTEPQAKVTLNICSRLQGGNLAQGVEEMPKECSSTENAAGDTGNLQPGAETLMEDDEEFESASQVTGPRQPVWDSNALSARSGGSSNQKLLKEALTAKELQSMEKHLADIEKDLALMAEASMSRSPGNQLGAGTVASDPQGTYHGSTVQNTKPQVPNQTSANLQLHLKGSKSPPQANSRTHGSNPANNRPQTPNSQTGKLQTPVTPLGRPVTPNSISSRPLTPSHQGNKDGITPGQRSRSVTVKSQIGLTSSTLSGVPAQIAVDTLPFQRNNVTEEESYEQLQGSRQPWILPSDTDSEGVETEKEIRNTNRFLLHTTGILNYKLKIIEDWS
ncbi:uncharacterized protein C8orf34 homolog isoform X2 [Pseudophryne corroboree]|uniref:uncharacterized protein C8orf34 homolog isoform X2 n=1 Tax=Pseudophryne corroboree TaxID=495146 RepID=UPI003081EC38